MSGVAYSPKEFKMAIIAEATIGTANTTTMQLMNVDSVSLPSLNPTQVLDIRTGDGRTLKSSDVFTSEKATVKEISFEGTADTTVLPILIQAITTTAVGTSPASYDIAYNYSPPSMGDGVSNTGDTGTFTVAVVSPDSAESSIFSGCTLTSLAISGDMGTESGRVKMSGTFMTGYKPSYGQSTPTSMASYGSTFYSLTDLTTTKTVAGKASSVIQSLSINLENPSEYIGYQGADGDPQSIVRAVPEIMASLDASVKYDDVTADLHEDWMAGSSVASELSNNATWSSATGFGVKIDNGHLTSVGWNESNAMFIDVNIKATASTSGDVIQVIV